MARQSILPIAIAMALTVAAGLSIAAEHAHSHAAAASDAPAALSATRSAGQSAGHRGIVSKAVDIKAPQGMEGVGAAAPAAVGSRALTGSQMDDPTADNRP